MISPLLNDVVSGQTPEPLLFSTEQYHRLTETGVLLEGSPLELIEGVIVKKDRRDAKGNAMIHGPRHGYSLTKLYELLDRQIKSSDCHVRNQLPITLTDNTEPEPDLALVQGSPEDFTDRHPQPGEILIAIEIADSSLHYDRTTKQRIYATANIPSFWIVNLSDRTLEVYETPGPDSAKYASKTVFTANQDAQLTYGQSNQLSLSLPDFLPPSTP